MTVTFSLALATSWRSMAAWIGGLGLVGVTGEADSLDGGLDDVVEEDVVGRSPADLEDVDSDGDDAGEFRERKGEVVEEDRWDLELPPAVVPNMGVEL